MAWSNATWLLLADAVLLLHFHVVVFVIGGLLLVMAGRVIGWRWVSNRWFRCLHLLAIAYVALQAWLDVVCPLTKLEMALRARAGAAVYEGSFVGHWLQSALYYEAPAWVFTVCYTFFALLVAFVWWWAPPRPFGDYSKPAARR